MKFSTSLKLNHIFRRLYHTNGFADSCLVLYARKNRSEMNRVGITVSKKLGHAVVRNRTRRRLREFRRLRRLRGHRHLHERDDGFDAAVGQDLALEPGSHGCRSDGDRGSGRPPLLQALDLPGTQSGRSPRE